jgi:hypothetical protein
VGDEHQEVDNVRRKWTRLFESLEFRQPRALDEQVIEQR